MIFRENKKSVSRRPNQLTDHFKPSVSKKFLLLTPRYIVKTLMYQRLERSRRDSNPRPLA